MHGDVSAPCDLAELPRLLLGVADAGGANAHRLAGDARIPAWALSAGHAMVPTGLSARLFELVEHALGDPDVALKVPARHQIGDLNLYDYLFTTAPTLREALRASADFSWLISTNTQMEVESESDGATSYTFRLIEASGPGLASQSSRCGPLSPFPHRAATGSSPRRWAPARWTSAARSRRSRSATATRHRSSPGMSISGSCWTAW